MNNNKCDAFMGARVSPALSINFTGGEVFVMGEESGNIWDIRGSRGPGALRPAAARAPQ